MKINKVKLASIILVAVSFISLVISLVFMKTNSVLKFITSGIIIFFCACVDFFISLGIADYKKLIKERMPVYLAELFNAGVITREQFENPGKIEKEMFLSEYGSPLKKRTLGLVVFTIVCVDLAITVCLI